MTTAPATLRVHVPAVVLEPRGAIAAAALMLQLLRGIASMTTAVMAPARGASAHVSALHD